MPCRYTRKMDDGVHPKEWKHADLLILGVSRCGKTPLSIFLGQRGYKVGALGHLCWVARRRRVHLWDL